MTERVRVAVIIGSTREGRFGPRVAEWFAAHARRRPELDIDLVDLAATGLPEALTDPYADTGAPPPGPVRALAPRLAAADAFAVVTPEYNRSIPAPLKTAIDWFYREWQAKPVAVVAYGRDSGGALAAAHLRQVFAEVHAVTVPDAVLLPRYWELFAPDGSWPKPTADREAALKTTLDQLIWWAHALREARTARPYTV
ncbi:NADPH-dependent FMN reductase [Actinomadura kijaniata]|uniref:NADPH-dependent FMN reductase n=1 Tax=Actinomadura kijaniata TaxID=46161 RepID=UPI00082DABE4|nr:NAD(P)H-dependent oxidoreductase [Actinomadura kijaniata]